MIYPPGIPRQANEMPALPWLLAWGQNGVSICFGTFRLSLSWAVASNKN
jgi:hypothetical protein